MWLPSQCDDFTLHFVSLKPDYDSSHAHTLDLQLDVFVQWIQVLIKVNTSGATTAFIEHRTACIVGLGNLREASKG